MNKLNVFQNDFCPWEYLSNWPKNARLFFRQFKWAYQRITRGYCDFDYWDLDTYLTELLSQSIKTLADETHGYPGNEEFPTYESWQEYLYKIVDLLRFALKDDIPNEYEPAWLKTWEDKNWTSTLNDRTPEEEEITHKYLDKESENAQKQIDARNEAFKMIYHVYDHLWD